MKPDKIKFTPPTETFKNFQYPAVFKYHLTDYPYYLLAFSKYSGVVITDGNYKHNPVVGFCGNNINFESDTYEYCGPVTVKIDFDN